MMGYSTKPILFFSDEIVINVHTATKAQHLRPISIAEFANGRPVYLEQRDDNKEYIVSCGKYPDIEFIQGPELY